MSLASTFLYASNPVKDRSGGTSIALPNFSRSRSRLADKRSGNRSAMATSDTPCDDDSASSIAPVPRPPQPIRPIRMASLPDTRPPASALALGAIAVASAAVVAVFMKSRRVVLIVLLLSGRLPARRSDFGAQSFQIVLFFDRADDAEADERRIGVPPDALGALRIAAVPFFARRAARRAPQPRCRIVPRSAARDVRIPPVGGQQHRPLRQRRDPRVLARNSAGMRAPAGVPR